MSLSDQNTTAGDKLNGRSEPLPKVRKLLGRVLLGTLWERTLIKPNPVLVRSAAPYAGLKVNCTRTPCHFLIGFPSGEIANRGVAAPIQIVDPLELLNEQQIKEERCITNTFAMENLECIKSLSRRRLLANLIECHNAMRFVRRQKLRDGYSWYCRICKRWIAIQKCSFLKKAR